MSSEPTRYPDVAHGILVVDGYGIRINVERGHLNINDGIGRDRRQRRVPRIGHNLRRLILIGHNGSISLEALRWLDRVGIHFTQLDTDGQILTTSANPGLDNPRLRRAQHLAYDSEAGVDIARYIIDTKLAGQADAARAHLTNGVADQIEEHRQQLNDAPSVSAIVKIEAKAAKDYFAAWSERVAITWATTHHHRVPDHWHMFKVRRSALTVTGSYRATNPINAILNYLYALAEIECRHACLILGLDPGLGYLHADVPQRDSLALDLIETIRPNVDDYVLELLQHHTFRADDFSEDEDGHCRINAPLTHRLGATLLDWQLALAPHAEHVARSIASNSDRAVGATANLTRGVPLQAHANTTSPQNRVRAHHPRSCRDCGTTLAPTARLYCPGCLPSRRAIQRRKAIGVSAASLSDASSRSARGRQISEGKLAAKIAAASDFGYEVSDWEAIEHEVRKLSLKQIKSATGLAVTQASKIKTGKTLPHPRYWSRLMNEASQPSGS